MPDCPEFPYVVEDVGYVAIRRPEADEVIHRDVRPGDVFSVSPAPEHELHHNHTPVCRFNARTDYFHFVRR